MTADRLGADGLRATMEWFRDALAMHRDVINQLNVYPVPDGDTGTNMALTLETVVTEVSAAGDQMSEVCHAISHGSLMGARGNSGVILSQILRGLAETVATAGHVDPLVLAGALKKASVAADEAVSTPVEGTILTVVRDVANAAAEAVEEGVDGLLQMVEGCQQAGRASLDRTPELLPQLARANVVDAGGAGFLLFLDAMATAMDGRPLPDPPPVDPTAGVGAAVAGADDPHGVDDDADGTRYEVMFFLEADDDRIGDFRSAWEALGDSIVVVGGDGLWNCHIHSNDIGASIEAGIGVGRPYDIRVTDLFEQVEHVESLTAAEIGGTVTTIAGEPVHTAVVAVSVGAGVRRIFESLGVRAVIAGGQTMNPSTEHFVQAVEQLDAAEIVLLPNNKNIVPVAERVDDCTDAVVRVVPTKGIAEGLAALMAYDPSATADQNQEAMADAASEVVTGEVTQAVRDTESELGPIAAGQWLGLDRGGLRVVAQGAAQAATGLLAEIIDDGHELVTVIAGADAASADVGEVSSWLAEHHPAIEVEIHEGNQPLYPFYFGVE
ncbi:MAG: DAK2 domain-containing protein [Acidimicrobiia bacterium]|nr:DAK2 domain-containing protein [Acidimicrobiia bacterium]MXZ84715.1 DAK2 domain-containing protein [Acidimicrobiia bacterium]MYE74739.1 DAK2 domain-containing protein [Acidimicrobiia bacterium]MYG73712.1 DAK2 domain-containing protein [Acidimicrobiia bacterium]MYH96363.1 DAK2 domain-containing protein [Acidimicrobiia bacterium]